MFVMTLYKRSETKATRSRKMTLHMRTEEFKPNRTALPRRLVGRRSNRFVNHEYAFEFEIGQPVILICTNELAVIVGRTQTIGCLDEYTIEIVDADCAPLDRVQAHQMTDASLLNMRRSSDWPRCGSRRR
jgi:hypothetical protein